MLIHVPTGLDNPMFAKSQRRRGSVQLSVVSFFVCGLLLIGLVGIISLVIDQTDKTQTAPVTGNDNTPVPLTNVKSVSPINPTAQDSHPDSKKTEKKLDHEVGKQVKPSAEKIPQTSGEANKKATSKAEVIVKVESDIKMEQENVPLLTVDKKLLAKFAVTPPLIVDTPKMPDVILPLKRLPKLGTWTIYGTDRAGNKWTATMVLTKNIDSKKNVGYIDWVSAVASGREHFYGMYDPKTKRIRWKGHRIENPRGNIIHANYEAEVSADKMRLVNGRWSGNGSIPGNWYAVWKEQ